MKVLLSIKPEFADKIFNGTKKYEFRKEIFNGSEVLIGFNLFNLAYRSNNTAISSGAFVVFCTINCDYVSSL